MKKHLLIFGASLAIFASCSDDMTADYVPDGTPVEVNFSAVLPEGLATRAADNYYGDGTSAKKILYAVYKANGSAVYESLKEESFPDGALQTNIPIQLVTGETYTVVFWAQDASTTAYTFDMTNHMLKVNYNEIANNNEALDAFYASVTLTVKANELNQTAELRRPFCQVNIATKDLGVVNQTGTLPTTSQISFSNVPTEMDFFNGTVNEGSLQTLQAADLPTWKSTLTSPAGKVVVNGTEYDYLSMTYFLAPAEGATQEVKMTVNNFSDGLRSYNSIPVKRNYRTNIVGDLLTSTTIWDVQIVPAFDDDENVNMAPSVWDGNTTPITPVEKVVNGKTVQFYDVQEASQLAYLAENMPTGEDAYINIARNMDLSGQDWNTLGEAKLSGNSVSGAFQGVINGNGKTISGLTISSAAPRETTGDKDRPGDGFISALAGNGVIRDLNFTNVNIGGQGDAVGAVVGLMTDNAVVENVNVISGTISSKDGVGGICGRMSKTGTIKNCTNGATVSSNGKTGGIIGAAYYNTSEGVMKIEGCTNNGVVTSTAGYTGGIAGLSAAQVSNCTNTAEISGASTCVGGIVGQQDSSGSVTNCTNEGNIVNNATATNVYGTGGIIGWIRYTNNANYPYHEVVTVSGCVNKGSVKGSNDAGGIVGVAYSHAKVVNNKNYAASLTGATFTSGIVGSAQYSETPMPDLEEKIYVRNNLSTTLLANMTGTCKHLFVWDNDGGHGKTVIEGNTTE